jgi:hypothetical protein
MIPYNHKDIAMIKMNSQIEELTVDQLTDVSGGHHGPHVGWDLPTNKKADSTPTTTPGFTRDFGWDLAQNRAA